MFLSQKAAVWQEVPQSFALLFFLRFCCFGTLLCQSSEVEWRRTDSSALRPSLATDMTAVESEILSSTHHYTETTFFSCRGSSDRRGPKGHSCSLNEVLLPSSWPLRSLEKPAAHRRLLHLPPARGLVRGEGFLPHLAPSMPFTPNNYICGRPSYLASQQRCLLGSLPFPCRCALTSPSGKTR